MEIDVSIGWVKLYRDLFNHPVWIGSTLAQQIIFLHLLCMASHKSNQWEFLGEIYDINPGEFVTSLDSIVRHCNHKEITKQKVRGALDRFEKFGFLTRKTTHRNTLISIVNWGKYQSIEDDTNTTTNTAATQWQHSGDTPSTHHQHSVNTYQENNNLKIEKLNNAKNISSIPKGIDCPSRDVAKIISEWNTLEIYGIKAIKKIANGTKRHTCLLARLKQYGVEEILNAIDNIRLSDFLQGKNKNGWTISFDWFLLPNNFIKVLEGNYSNTALSTKQTKSNAFERAFGDFSTSYKEDDIIDT